VLEWRVANLSPAELELVIEEPPAKRLALSGPKGTVPLPAPAGSRRAVKLGPGEFVGGTFPDAEEKLGPPGRYRLEWSIGVLWSGRSLSLPAPPVDVERRAR
jgi:hypothetical protein